MIYYSNFLLDKGSISSLYNKDSGYFWRSDLSKVRFSISSNANNYLDRFFNFLLLVIWIENITKTKI